ncbi:hypothetical protein [Clostridium puniceum]|nr:hypothetical protein [Clostridium puniceum]
MYLSKVGEPSPDNGGGSPSYFASRRRVLINFVNVKNIYNLLTILPKK